jgi:hypothetical protein
MKGAREYSNLFKTGQYGKLYLVCGDHARGKTFRIFVLKEGIEAIPNGYCNAPLNEDTVEVYGVVSGNPGWTESYGWLHEGPWQDDFIKMVNTEKDRIKLENEKHLSEKELKELKEKEHEHDLLSLY